MSGSSSAPRVKICGLRSVETAVAAAEAGADFLGFNFAPVSKRRVSVEVARAAIEVCRRESLPLPKGEAARRAGEGSRAPGSSDGSEGAAALTVALSCGSSEAAAALTRALSQRERGRGPGAVGIFVNQSVDEVVQIAAACGLEYIQLSGDETPAYCREVAARSGLAVIKAVRLGDAHDVASAEAYTGDGGVGLLLADAAVAGAWGGTGQRADWDAAAALAARYPLLLAGGLTPENVAGAVAAVHPWGVDVASGVETDEQTDPDKVRAFIDRVGDLPPGPLGKGPGGRSGGGHMAVATAPDTTTTHGLVRPTTPRVLSGVQPSGNLHLGNYIGAIKRWVEHQERYDNFFCIVDLHAITVPQDPLELRRNTRELAAFYVAAGIDPHKSTVFVQSHVPAHAELGWILNCVTPMGWLERMTQFKDKAAKEGDNRERISAGLFDYPVLMAADILLYQAQYVPVGEDQKQHIEITRDIAERFNRLYGDTFVVPDPMIAETGARIMGLEDPTVKMSKSDPSPRQRIGVYDDPDTIRRNIMRATTDSLRDIRFDESRPGINNLLTIYLTLSGDSRAQIEAHFAGKGYGDLKRELADLVIATLAPIQARARQLLSSGELEDVLAQGAAKAAPIANETLRHVMYAMGLR
ncbi:MAG: tryptophan--tRNA ligase [Chloroflexi bacterium]|nr:tryptophan--tRNA ligase [Chloroflexota bacterium]